MNGILKTQLNKKFVTPFAKGLLLLVFMTCATLQANEFADQKEKEWKAFCKTLPPGPALSLQRKGKEVGKFTDFESAFAKAKSGDVLKLGKGVYSVTKDLRLPGDFTIIGEGDETVLGACEFPNSSFSVVGYDSTVQNVMFSNADFTTATLNTKLWLEDVGNAAASEPGYVIGGSYGGPPEPRVIRLFGHAYSYKPGREDRLNNFCSKYKTDEKYGGNSSTTRSTMPYYDTINNWCSNVPYDYKMPQIPREVVQQTLDYLADNKGKLESDFDSNPFKREVHLRLLAYFKRKYPDTKMNLNESAVEDSFAKAKEELAKKHPILARYYIEKAEQATKGSQAAEIGKLREQTLAAGLGRYGCYLDMLDSGPIAGASSSAGANMERILSMKLHEKFPILALGDTLTKDAKCRIHIVTAEIFYETRTDIVQKTDVTWVETEASKEKRRKEKEMAEAEARAAEKAASLAVQDRLDRMMNYSQKQMQNMYDGRTRIEKSGGDVYVISSRDRDPGRGARIDSQTQQNVDAAKSSADAARANAAGAGNGDKSYEQKKVYSSTWSVNANYSFSAKIDMTENGKTVFKADNPSTAAHYSKSGCSSSSKQMEVHRNCASAEIGQQMARPYDYFETHVDIPLINYLTFRWSKDALATLKAAEKKSNEADKLEALLLAHLLGAPVGETDISPLLKKQIDPQMDLAKFKATVFKK